MCPGKQFGKKWKSDGFLLVWYFERKIVGLGAKEFGQVMSKVYSVCTEKRIEEMKNFEKRWFRSNFRAFSEKFSYFEPWNLGLLLKNLGQVFKTAIYVSRKTIWKKMKKWWFLISLVLWAKHSRIWGERIWAGDVKSVFCVSREVYWGNEKFWKKDGSLVLFVPLAKTFPTWAKKNFRTFG